jgi:ABC-type uncharacterized transport system ATPase subunit
MKQERKEVMVVNGLTKRISTITAVDNISFSVPDSEIFGFLGPNGAGKKTTIEAHGPAHAGRRRHLDWREVRQREETA